jgi:hypothetical protein
MDEPQQTSNAMVLTVAGRDRSGDLGLELKAAAVRLDNSELAGLLAGEAEILKLGEAADESAFLTQQLKLLGFRTEVDPGTCAPPRTTGWTGWFITLARRLLWRLMRYPHDFMAGHQNAVNAHLLRALELETRLRRRETAALRERIAALEAGRRESESDGS